MRIGIDIDDTITNSHDYVIYLKKKYLPQYDSTKLLPDDVFREFINKYDSLIHKNAPLKEGVVEAITYLKNAGHTIYIMRRIHKIIFYGIIFPTISWFAMWERK